MSRFAPEFLNLSPQQKKVLNLLMEKDRRASELIFQHRIMRPSAIVHELRKKGVQIETVRELKQYDSSNHKIPVARYVFKALPGFA